MWQDYIKLAHSHVLLYCGNLGLKGDASEFLCLLGCDAVWFGKLLRKFRIIVLVSG